MIKNFEKKTRSIFDKIHLKQIASRSPFKKASTLYDFNNLRLNKNH